MIPLKVGIVVAVVTGIAAATGLVYAAEVAVLPAVLPVLPPSTQFDITGMLQEATLDPACVAAAGSSLDTRGNPQVAHCGGTMKLNGQTIVVPVGDHRDPSGQCAHMAGALRPVTRAVHGRGDGHGAGRQSQAIHHLRGPCGRQQRDRPEQRRRASATATSPVSSTSSSRTSTPAPDTSTSWTTPPARCESAACSATRRPAPGCGSTTRPTPRRVEADRPVRPGDVARPALHGRPGQPDHRLGDRLPDVLPAHRPVPLDDRSSVPAGQPADQPATGRASSLIHDARPCQHACRGGAPILGSRPRSRSATTSPMPARWSPTTPVIPTSDLHRAPTRSPTTPPSTRRPEPIRPTCRPRSP